MNMTELLRLAIRSSGKSLNQIEAESEIGKGVLSRFVAGSRDLQLETAARLAEYLGLVLMPAEEVTEEMLGRLDEIAGQAAHAQEVLETVMEGMKTFTELRQAVRSGVASTTSKAKVRGGPKAGSAGKPVETYIEITPQRKKPST